jgi:hypothetical protein
MATIEVIFVILTMNEFVVTIEAICII